MSQISRRALLRSAAILGSSALFGRWTLRAAHATQTQTLTLYNGQHAQTTAALVRAFTEATGIHVDIRKGSSSQLANQIIEEGQRSPADLFYAEESPPLAALSEKGLLAVVDASTRSQIRPNYEAKDGTWIGASARCRVVAYNKAMVDEKDLPASVLDFAKPQWQDKVAFVPTSGAFQEQLVAIEKLKGRDVALAWLKGLKQYGRIYNGNMAAMRAVEKGEIATALVNNYYWYVVAKEVGEANMQSALLYMKNQDPGALITVSAAGILKSSKNQQAAQQFLAFMVGEAGQQAIAASVAEYPLRPGVASPYDLKPFDELEPPPVSPADLGDAAQALSLRREAGLA